MEKHCEGMGGKCSRKAKWTWEDDSMKVHHACTQHKHILMPPRAVDIIPPPKCCGEVSNLKCECAKYTCTFSKKLTLKKGPLFNRGRGIRT